MSGSGDGRQRVGNRRELHLVSDGKRTMHSFVQVVQALTSWIDVVHVREKTKPARVIADWVQQLRLHTSDQVQITVNDRVDVAWACGLNRVHLAGHSLPVREVKRAFPGIIAGCSVHARDEAMRMEAEGADYVLFGHIFPTASKPGLPARGLERLHEVCASVRIPVIAIGGIVPEQVGQVIRAGASGIAVMSGIVQAEDPLRAARMYREALDTEGEKR